MSDMSVEERLEKLEQDLAKTRWQLGRVGDGLSGDGHQLGRLVVLRDICEDELTKLHDVFEAQEAVLKVRADSPNWDSFNLNIRSALPRETLHVYEVVFAMYESGAWKDICSRWMDWSRKNPNTTGVPEPKQIAPEDNYVKGGILKGSQLQRAAANGLLVWYVETYFDPSEIDLKFDSVCVMKECDFCHEIGNSEIEPHKFGDDQDVRRDFGEGVSEVFAVMGVDYEGGEG